MATYNKRTWESGELITAEKMNQIEDQLELLTPVTTSIVQDYNSGTSYIVGDYCLQDGVLYRCLVAGSGHEPSLSSNYWVQTSVMEELGSGVSKSIAGEYSDNSSTNYTAGMYVIYQHKLYRCTANTTGGNWESSKWTEVILGNDINNLRSNVVLITNAQPNTPFNRIWINSASNETTVPTMADMAEAVGGAVHYDVSQTLEDAEKAQARSNIGAASQDEVDEIRATIQELLANL